MQTFDDLEYTTRSLNACIYSDISVNYTERQKKLLTKKYNSQFNEIANMYNDEILVLW